MSVNDIPQRLASLPVDQLLERIAQDRPLLPAGGSVAALAGANAAALAGFVSRIARRHAEKDATRHAIDPIISDFDRLRRRLADLMTEDVRAYSDAMKMKQNGVSDPESIRVKMMAGPPEKMADAGLEMLVLFTRLLPHVYPPAMADFAVAVQQTKSFIDSAVLIWRASVSTGEDAGRQDPMAARIDRLGKISNDYYDRLRPVL